MSGHFIPESSKVPPTPEPFLGTESRNAEQRARRRSGRTGAGDVGDRRHPTTSLTKSRGLTTPNHRSGSHTSLTQLVAATTREPAYCLTSEPDRPTA